MILLGKLRNAAAPCVKGTPSGGSQTQFLLREMACPVGWPSVPAFLWISLGGGSWFSVSALHLHDIRTTEQDFGDVSLEMSLSFLLQLDC